MSQDRLYKIGDKTVDLLRIVAISDLEQLDGQCILLDMQLMDKPVPIYLFEAAWRETGGDDMNGWCKARHEALVAAWRRALEEHQ